MKVAGTAPHTADAMGGVYQFADVTVDLDRFELHRAGVPQHVEPQVMEVLAYLIRHRDRLVTKQELMDQVWHDRFISDSAITSRIKAARRATGDDGERQTVIRTVHGRGYRFVAEVAQPVTRRNRRRPRRLTSSGGTLSLPPFGPRWQRQSLATVS